MTELTAEKRAELRRLAEACPDDLKLSCVECGSCYVGECQCVGRKRFNFEFNRYRVVSLLDALEAAEAKLAQAWDEGYEFALSGKPIRIVGTTAPQSEPPAR